MSNKLIRQLFESRLNTWAKARVPTLRVAFQDVAFTPASGETYLRCFLLPATTDSEDLAGAHRGYRGVFQVSIVTPSGQGQGQADGIAVELDTLFPVNLRLTSGAFTVQVLTPMSSAAAIQGDTSSSLPVSCTYRADTI